ncbi:outer membrane protein [Martelella radicis]|uniref:Outer membrane immunogenic protein n=1 Tax=Martelella radicis TaxID=1397476 RepID=A0A7W6KKR3_9HYPH|nr:outer membrane beta-barrel protein [Martelella radicis]MBB4121655.1 outer membrane immunogenic protein [Martelella radicis]
MTRTVAAAFMAALAGGPSLAADLAVTAPAPVYQEVYVEENELPWDGPYLGLRGGYDWTHTRGTISGAGGSSSWSDSLAGAQLGAFGGYNFQFENNLVVGAEADANYTFNESQYVAGGVSRNHGIDWSGSLRGRIGYAVGNALIYGTAGAAVANFYLGTGSKRPHEVIYGYTVGAGVDYAFTENIFARLEYRYTGYPSADFTGYFGAGNKADQKASSNTVTVGLGAKF